MRLIDADALKARLNNCYIVSTNGERFSVKHTIDGQSTIEPEVRHGRWLSYTGTHYTGKEDEYGDPEYKEHIFFVCSNCRRKTVVRENFCPNCGAKMDGGADNG